MVIAAVGLLAAGVDGTLGVSAACGYLAACEGLKHCIAIFRDMCQLKVSYLFATQVQAPAQTRGIALSAPSLLQFLVLRQNSFGVEVCFVLRYWSWSVHTMECQPNF